MDIKRSLPLLKSGSRLFIRRRRVLNLNGVLLKDGQDENAIPDERERGEMMAFTKKGNWMGNFVKESRKIPPQKFSWKLLSTGKWVRYNMKGLQIPFNKR